jgi:two-component system, LuxR family, sensor kinase FixL
MSWVTVIWCMGASASLTLAVMQSLVWCGRRTAWANLVFSIAAVATAGAAGCELWMMRAETPREFGMALRWDHVPAWVVVLSLVGFVRLYLKAGRRWLAWTVGGMRTLSLLLNFVFTPNLNYREITSLRHIRFLGESVSVAQGVPNPWMLVGQVSFLLLLVFVVDATIVVWRRGDRRQALLVGGAIAFFSVGGIAQVLLVLWGVILMPLMTSLFFVSMVAAMGAEMIRDMLRAAQLSDDLHESNERFRQVAETVGEFIWEMDANGLYTYASPSVEKTLGYTPEDLVGKKHFYDLFAPSVCEQLKAATFQVFAERQTFRNSPISNVSKNGRILHLESSGTPVLDPAGNLLSYRGADTDVSVRKEAEQKIAQQRNEVAHLSRVTTLGEISGSLAHELNQPLGAILVNTDSAELHLQSRTPNLEAVRAILADIRKDDLRAGEIIHGIRAFLRRKELEMQPLEVGQLAGEAVKLISADAATRKTTVGLEIPPGLPCVTGDRVHLQQVLINLLVNGMDAMSTCPVADRHITIRATRSDPHTVEIAVSDLGVGIPPGELDQVFTPFRTTKQGGLGLGLPICRSIVEAHGGSISIKNNSNRGATARFSLPACVEGQT